MGRWWLAEGLTPPPRRWRHYLQHMLIDGKGLPSLAYCALRKSGSWPMQDSPGRVLGWHRTRAARAMKPRRTSAQNEVAKEEDDATPSEVSESIPVRARQTKMHGSEPIADRLERNVVWSCGSAMAESLAIRPR